MKIRWTAQWAMLAMVVFGGMETASADIPYSFTTIDVPRAGDSRAGAKTEEQKSQDFLFEVRPRKIAPGEAAVLRWSIKGATRVTIEEASNSEIGRHELMTVGSFEGSSGTLEVRPKEDTTYVIECEGSTTYTCASVTVRVRVKTR